jgi:large subunit ribosomal protein L6
VTVTVEADNTVTVKGPKGELRQRISRELSLCQEEGLLKVERPNNSFRLRGQHGLARTLLANMVQGVTQGHVKSLEVQGVGYRVQADGKGLNLSMGYSHPVKVAPVDGIEFQLIIDEKARKQEIVVKGIDKALVGQVAADIRKVRRPDSYKGKGIRYKGEVVKLKAGKRASAKK